MRTNMQFVIFGNCKSTQPRKGLEPLALRLKVWCSTDWATGAARFLGDPRVFCSPGATYVYGLFFPYGLCWCAVKRQEPFRNGHHLKGHMKCQSHWDVVVPLRSYDGPSESDELIRPNMSLQSGTYISKWAKFEDRSDKRTEVLARFELATFCV